MKQKILTQQEIKTKISPLLKKHEVVRATLFGSYAHGDAHATSDVDILIEYHNIHTKSLFDLVALKDALEKKLGKKVDLGTFDSLHPRIKKQEQKFFVTLYDKTTA